MRTSRFAAYWNRIKAAGAASEQRGTHAACAHLAGNERVLRELLAEAHTRIRLLEKALDQFKTAI